MVLTSWVILCSSSLKPSLMGMSCNLSLRFVAFSFSTIADPLWSCLNLLTAPYSCSKFSVSHKILHIGQLLWENSWCLLVFALKVQARCFSGAWPYPSCCVWGVRASSATNPVVLGFASHPLQALKHSTPLGHTRVSFSMGNEHRIVCKWFWMYAENSWGVTCTEEGT